VSHFLRMHGSIERTLNLVLIDLLNGHHRPDQLQNVLRLTDHSCGETDESIEPSDVPQVNGMVIALSPQTPSKERCAASIDKAQLAECRQERCRRQQKDNETRNCRYEGEGGDRDARPQHQCVAPGIV
jgi:hypothetical protein